MLLKIENVFDAFVISPRKKYTQVSKFARAYNLLIFDSIFNSLGVVSNQKKGDID